MPRPDTPEDSRDDSWSVIVDGFYADSAYYTGPPLDEDMLRRAEEDLGVRLPRSYVEMLYKRNGGTPKRRCFPTRFSTSWATDHFEISGVKGIAGDWGIDSTSDAGSAYLINEWGYPDIGVVICDMPSGGHDVVMLDYSGMRHECEPSVAYVDGDRIPRRIADSFAEFIEQLIECDDLPK